MSHVCLVAFSSRAFFDRFSNNLAYISERMDTAVTLRCIHPHEFPEIQGGELPPSASKAPRDHVYFFESFLCGNGLLSHHHLSRVPPLAFVRGWMALLSRCLLVLTLAWHLFHLESRYSHHSDPRDLTTWPSLRLSRPFFSNLIFEQRLASQVLSYSWGLNPASPFPVLSLSYIVRVLDFPFCIYHIVFPC